MSRWVFEQVSMVKGGPGWQEEERPVQQRNSQENHGRLRSRMNLAVFLSSHKHPFDLLLLVPDLAALQEWHSSDSRNNNSICRTLTVCQVLYHLWV